MRKPTHKPPIILYAAQLLVEDLRRASGGLAAMNSPHVREASPHPGVDGSLAEGGFLSAARRDAACLIRDLSPAGAQAFAALQDAADKVAAAAGKQHAAEKRQKWAAWAGAAMLGGGRVAHEATRPPEQALPPVDGDDAPGFSTWCPAKRLAKIWGATAERPAAQAG